MEDEGEPERIILPMGGLEELGKRVRGIGERPFYKSLKLIHLRGQKKPYSIYTNYSTYKPLKNLRAVALIFCVLEREKKESPRLIIFLYRLGESVTYFPNRTTPRTRQAAHGHEQRLTLIFPL